MARQERKEIAEFNAALQSLPSRNIPENRYKGISPETLNKEQSGLGSSEESKTPTHRLFGKRFRVKGVVGYHPINFKNELPERVSLESWDANDPKNTWGLEADLESLGREERAFIRNQCEYLSLNSCPGEFFGVIGIIRRGEFLESLGMQIEYIELSPREVKKAP